MEKIYDKLRQMPETKYVMFQRIVGLLSGILCWLALRVGNFSDDNLVAYLFLAVCVIIILGSRGISKKIERPVQQFQIFLAIGLGVCIAIFALFTFILSPYVFTDGEQKGLIELIFNIAV